MAISTIGQNSLAQSRILTPANQPAGAVLQVQQFQLTTTASTSTNSMTDTGLSLTITPTSATSKFLLVLHAFLGTNLANTSVALNFARNGTAIGLSTGATGSGANFGTATGMFNTSHGENVSMSYLDSPATASAITYKVQWMSQSGYVAYLNKSPASFAANGDTYAGAYTSTLTVYEIAG